MIIKHPDFNNIDQIMELNRKYFFTNQTDIQKQIGFLGKEYSRDELQQIIADNEIIISISEGKIIGYYLIGRKDDEDAAAYQRNKALNLTDTDGIPFSNIAYPCQVCIDKDYRNKGLFGKMLYALIKAVKAKYTNVLCSVSEDNIASIKAHMNNGWELINTFEERKFFIYKI